MRIAIIGSGISGLVSAYLLHPGHDIVVFEANDYIGGHTHTVDVTWAGRTYAVDTGFIVFNEATYPNFVKLLKRLGVSWQPSTMSFSVNSKKDGLEYSPSSLNALFAQRRNLFRPSFYRMIYDIFRFRRESMELLRRKDQETTLGDYLKAKGYSETFVHDFIIPMGSAIWSAAPEQSWHLPARFFIRFFDNHGFLKIRNQPQWLVIKGGSKRYVEKLSRGFRDRIRLACPVMKVTRHADCVEVTPEEAASERFDQVIIATHSDQALAMLADPSEAERRILGSIPYQKNLAILHTDTSCLPKRRACWASWNYHVPETDLDKVAVTYDMNILQQIKAPVEFCVTLNLVETIGAEKIIRNMVYHHPVFTPTGLASQKQHEEINGVNRTYFCGAYWGFGFHEDGVNSALAVCRHFGKRL
jgi:predicted NAD/FAD-binding protein